jgi:general secretion pathway protein J
LNSKLAAIIRNNGFTLIELLVALAILTIIGVGSVTALNAMLDQQQIIARNDRELQDLQKAMQIIRTDIYQLHPREIRDVIGDAKLPALLTDPSPELLLIFSRDGWRNPLGLQRGTLQRVQYRLEEDVLIREYWPVMDRLLGTEPETTELLQDVQSAEFEFLDDSDRWQTLWPPLQTAGTAAPSWPRAIRLTIELASMGEIERLYEVPR